MSHECISYAVYEKLLKTTMKVYLQMIISAEAYFNHNDYVNKQNYRVWSTENPKATHKRLLNPLQVNVWCEIQLMK
jgi:hypothetical protein